MENRTEQELVRFAKLAELRAEGFAFPNDVKPNADARTIAALDFAVEPGDTLYTLAGRLVQLRVMGKAAFAHILDAYGKFQIYVRRDAVGEESYQAFKRWDIGDIIAVSGRPFLTKTGEKTIEAQKVRLLTKALIPLPEKFHGLTDVEARYRSRYVDLIANPEVRQIFRARAEIIRWIRAFLDQRDFLEVETPVLHYIAGGATARPFKTHYNALHCDMNLRIALELPLKKLLVGGLERVYEIGRVFRNEGVSKKHNPEFTMLEFYQAYATFAMLMDLTEDLIGGLVTKLQGGTTLSYNGQSINFQRPWRRLSMVEACYELGGVDRSVDLSSRAEILAEAGRRGINISPDADWGRALMELYEETAEAQIVDPVFITHHPFSVSPLARKNGDNPLLTDRFELIVAGMEIANAFSELNDAVDQRERFEQQAAAHAAGDEEANELDEDFLRALEYGMPPAGGEGIGIDRLTMLLTDSLTIRDVLFFPQLRPADTEAPAVEPREAAVTEPA